MEIRSLVAVGKIGFILLLVLGIKTDAAELRVLSANGLKEIMEGVTPKFERATGHELAISFATVGAIVKRVEGGEIADVVIIPQPQINSLVKKHKVPADQIAVFARSGIGVAVRKGAPKPDISSPEAFKRALLAAKSITYNNPAEGSASGIHFAKVLDRLQIANEMKLKTVFLPKPGPVAVLVATGEVEIAVQAMPELVSIAGIDIVGPLPGDLQNIILAAAATMAGTNNVEASRALVNFLRAPEVAPVIKASGMEPVIP